MGEKSGTTGRPRLVTIVLNTNRRDDTLECLASLDRQTIAADNHVIVLDNRSTDGSVEAIRRAFPCADILSLPRDGGYAGNNNVGIRNALEYRPDWIFVLNEDTVLDPECLQHLVAAGTVDARIGIVGPLVLHHDEPTVIQSAGGRLGPYWEAIHDGANQDDVGQFHESRDVDWVSGCALMVRADAIAGAGVLDERFYYYWEELEWCLRLRAAGWHIVHVPRARLWHKGVKRQYVPSPNVTYYNTRNRFLMLSRHRPPAYVWAGAWVQTVRTLAAWSLRPKYRAYRPHRDAMLQGVRDFCTATTGIRSSSRRPAGAPDEGPEVIAQDAAN